MSFRAELCAFFEAVDTDPRTVVSRLFDTDCRPNGRIAARIDRAIAEIERRRLAAMASSPQLGEH